MAALPSGAPLPRPWPWLYAATGALVRLGVRIFYRRVVVHTVEHVPPRGPAIFAATHPNSITDPLVLGACVPRRINYLAHSGLFRKPLLGRLLPRCGVIPVYRPEDFPGPVDNSLMFSRCTEALVRGEAIGIFPEGTSHQEERVRKLRTGTARIALEAEDAAGFELGIQIVPVGLNFHAPGRFRSDVLILIGPPLVLHPYRALYRSDPVQAVQDVTAELKRRLESLVLELPTPDFLPLVRTTVRLLRDTDAARPADVLAEHFAARDVGAALAWAARERPLEYARYARTVEEHARSRRQLGVSEEVLGTPRSRGVPTTAAARLRALLGLPFALVGALTHAVPYRLTRWVTSKLHPDPTKVATVKFTAGAALFTLWYLAQGVVVWRLLGAPAAVLYLVALVPCGFLAVRYLDAWKAVLRGARDEWIRTRRKAGVTRLATERTDVARAARKLWDAFHAEQRVW